MIANRLRGDQPALYRMAVLAVGAELTAMNVRMAIRAVLTYVLEDEACMALGACNLAMHAAQRVAGLIVIEFWVGANRLPACVGMAVLARYCNRSVRIGDLCLRSANLRPCLFVGEHNVLADDKCHQAGDDQYQPGNTTQNPPRLPSLQRKTRDMLAFKRLCIDRKVIERLLRPPNFLSHRCAMTMWPTHTMPRTSRAALNACDSGNAQAGRLDQLFRLIWRLGGQGNE